jgi:hypothetical protein
MGYILGGLLALAGGIFAFFFISEFSVFADKNLEWLAVILTMVGIVGFIGGAYIIYNMRKSRS